jgi:hypothetical protein
MGIVESKLELFKRFDYEPHPKQLLVHKSLARFRTLCSGRRFGKSLLASFEAIAALMPKNQIGWIVSPTYELSKKVFREVYMHLHKYMPFFIESSSEHNQYIKLKNGSVLLGKSADNPVSLLGEGLNFLIIDEAARLRQSDWEEALRPTLADKGGWCLFISTPRGKNWFFEEWTRGQDREETSFESWNFKSSDNPYIPLEEVEHARKHMPERVYLQEWEGVFIEELGGVFRNVRECVKGSLEEPVKDKSYIMGVDLAKHQDFTVIVVMDRERKHVVAFDRFHQLDWNLQKARIESMCRKYNNAEIVLDATGVGDPIYDDLCKANLNVTPFKISAGNKTGLIENLSLRIQEREITYPDIPELLNELNIYEYTVSRSGYTRYSAPEGYHDDIVIALALSVWGMRGSLIFDFG